MSLISFVPFMMDDVHGMTKSIPLSRNEYFSGSSTSAQEDDKEFRFSIDVPGVKAADLDVTVKDGYLHVSGMRCTASMKGKATKRARYERSWSLDEELVDVSKIKANLSDGVLVVTVPKKPKKDPVKITVTTEPHVESITPVIDAKENAETEPKKV